VKVLGKEVETGTKSNAGISFRRTLLQLTAVGHWELREGWDIRDLRLMEKLQVGAEVHTDLILCQILFFFFLLQSWGLNSGLTP
jgi:hypothetical protein